MRYFLAELNKAREAIERVRQLHQPIENGEWEPHCSHCREGVGYVDFVDYPCPTIKALDGDTNVQSDREHD